MDRFLSDGAREGVRDAGVTDNVSRGSVDMALKIQVLLYCVPLTGVNKKL